MDARPRLPLLLLALALCVGAWASRGRAPRASGGESAPAITWLHPVIPPLTHVPGAGEDLLAGGVPRETGGSPLREGVVRTVLATGTPTPRQALSAEGLADVGALARRARDAREGQRLREEVVREAVVLAETLGSARVEAVLRAKEDLSWRYAEGKVWREVARGR